MNVHFLKDMSGVSANVASRDFGLLQDIEVEGRTRRQAQLTKDPRKNLAGIVVLLERIEVSRMSTWIMRSHQ